MFTRHPALPSLLLAACLAAVVPMAASAQTAAPYPTKPITLQVGYQAGGSVDLVARIVGPSLAKRLGQPITIENSPGGGGTIAAGKVVVSPADGYTLLLGTPSEVGINQLTNKKLRYDAVKDFDPIGMIGTQPMVLVASPASGITSTEDFIKYAAAHPGKGMYASSGIGTPLHLAGEMIKQKSKIFLVHIPYRGAPAMATDMLGGQLDYGVFVLSSALPFLKDGRMKALGVTTHDRSAVAPNIPSLSETAPLKDMDVGVWFGLLAPAKTPAPILQRLRTELRAVLAEPDVKKKLQEAGVNLLVDVDFPKFLKSEIEKYKTVVDFASITE